MTEVSDASEKFQLELNCSMTQFWVLILDRKL